MYTKAEVKRVTTVTDNCSCGSGMIKKARYVKAEIKRVTTATDKCCCGGGMLPIKK